MKNKNNETCFKAHERLNLECKKCSCKCWFDEPEHLNCINLAAKKGSEKQEKIGKWFGLTRMRVCQLEKSIVNKLKKGKSLDEFSQLSS